MGVQICDNMIGCDSFYPEPSWTTSFCDQMVLSSIAETSSTMEDHFLAPGALNDPQVLQQYLSSIQEQEAGLKPQQTIPLYPWGWGGPENMNMNAYSQLAYPIQPYGSLPTTLPLPHSHTQQHYHFIDLTPDTQVDCHPASPSQPSPTSSPMKRQRTSSLVDRTIDMEKSRQAQQRRRDSRGKFLRNEVANRLEGKILGCPKCSRFSPWRQTWNNNWRNERCSVSP
jgi:hypothetical protein